MYTDRQQHGADSRDRPSGGGRTIGPIGTTARAVLGVLLVGLVAIGPFRPSAWALGLLGFPVVLLAWQWVRTRRNPASFQATGPAGFAVNAAVFFALLLTPWYAPAFAVTNNAALVFYGASMLLAAARGYAGCEVLAVSNWLLRRDDQVGCAVFELIDRPERARRG